MGPIAVYDSCVLYPAPLRDLLMHLAVTDLVRAKWTDRIHEEWIGSLLENRPDLSRDHLEHTRSLMNAHVLDCLVTGYEDLIEGLMLPDPDDRHVLAAAIRSSASVIVTFNIGDFPPRNMDEFAIEAQHPDTFISRLIDLDLATVCLAAKRQRASLKNPSKTAEEFLATLKKQRLSETVKKLRPFISLI